MRSSMICVTPPPLCQTAPPYPLSLTLLNKSWPSSRISMPCCCQSDLQLQEKTMPLLRVLLLMLLQVIWSLPLVVRCRPMLRTTRSEGSFPLYVFRVRGTDVLISLCLLFVLIDLLDVLIWSWS